MGVDAAPEDISCGEDGGNLTGQMLVEIRFLTSFPATPPRDGGGEGGGVQVMVEPGSRYNLTEIGLTSPPLPPPRQPHHHPARDWTQQMFVEAESRDGLGEGRRGG